MTGFTYALQREDGTPADPSTLKSAVPNWKAGDSIPLGSGRTLRVVEVRPGLEPDSELILVVEALDYGEGNG
jgi:hypothetical protein